MMNMNCLNLKENVVLHVCKHVKETMIEFKKLDIQAKKGISRHRIIKSKIFKQTEQIT